MSLEKYFKALDLIDYIKSYDLFPEKKIHEKLPPIIEKFIEVIKEADKFVNDELTSAQEIAKIAWLLREVLFWLAWGDSTYKKELFQRRNELSKESVFHQTFVQTSIYRDTIDHYYPDDDYSKANSPEEAAVFDMFYNKICLENKETDLAISRPMSSYRVNEKTGELLLRLPRLFKKNQETFLAQAYEDKKDMFGYDPAI